MFERIDKTCSKFYVDEVLIIKHTEISLYTCILEEIDF